MTTSNVIDVNIVRHPPSRVFLLLLLDGHNEMIAAVMADVQCRVAVWEEKDDNSGEQEESEEDEMNAGHQKYRFVFCSVLNLLLSFVLSF